MEKISHTLFNHKFHFTFIVFLLLLAHLLWDHLHGGVPRHYILHDPSMPSFSNWLSLLLIPVLSYGLIHLIQKRKTPTNATRIGYGFFGALFFGLTCSLLWELNQESILQYLILLPVALSLFIVVHFPENFLGFVLGMIYTFGGVLPIGFGVIIGFLAFVVHYVTNWGKAIMKQ